MAGSVEVFDKFMEGDSLAPQIANLWNSWKTARAKKEEDWKEVETFIFATDTRSTSTGDLGHKNSTTIPKLTQIRDNIHSNYMAALFPNKQWMSWESDSKEDADKQRRILIENYMRNRTENSGFDETISALLLDWIDKGNCFATVEYVVDKGVDDDGTEYIKYAGPRLVRTSPYDHVFNPLAASYDQASKITRSIVSLGELQKDADTKPEQGYKQEVVDLMLRKRQEFSGAPRRDVNKMNSIPIDGFGSVDQYLSSGMVEILEFEGDIYDLSTGELITNSTITIVDRSYIIRRIARTPFRTHVGWRKRPENLWAMGPLDNLVGMQYRIDHLENLKADVFDRIAQPQKKIKGEVADFSDDPNERIFVGEEGDVTYLHPPVEALNADFQIQTLEMKMEAFAGSPSEAMGIRTPGEKTAFEVDKLLQAGGRIFQQKIKLFEKMFVEVNLNEMFRLARIHAPQTPSVEKIITPDSPLIEFLDVSATDLQAVGKLKPRGAQHFAAKAKLIQELNTFVGSAVGQDPAVKVHFSGKEMARLIDEVMGFEQYKLFGENISITEMMETKRLQLAAEQQLQREAAAPVEADDETA